MDRARQTQTLTRLFAHLAAGTTDEAAAEMYQPVTAYVDPVAVGDPLPDAHLFLAPGWYVNVPLETTYQASWAETPQPIRERVEKP